MLSERDMIFFVQLVFGKKKSISPKMNQSTSQTFHMTQQYLIIKFGQKFCATTDNMFTFAKKKSYNIKIIYSNRKGEILSYRDDTCLSNTHTVYTGIAYL